MAGNGVVRRSAGICGATLYSTRVRGQKGQIWAGIGFCYIVTIRWFAGDVF